MSATDLIDSGKLNRRVYLWVNYLLVSLMMSCVAVTAVQLGELVLPNWNTWYLPGFCFLVALERLFTRPRMGDLAPFSARWLIAIITQWVVIIFIIRVLIAVSFGVDTLWEMIPQLGDDFFITFFSIELILALFLIGFVWITSGGFADLLEEIEISHIDLPLEALRYEMDKIAPQKRLTGLVLSIGAGLVTVTVLIRLDLRVLLDKQLSLPVDELPYLAAGAGNVLLYFVLGLALLSQSQFASLRKKWTVEGIPVSRDMAAKWALFSILFLSILAVVASLLPTSYTLGFLSILSYILGYILSIFVFIFGVLWSLLLLVISLPFLLFGGESPIDSPKMPPLPNPPLPSIETQPGTPIPWLEVLKSALFWIVFLSIIGFSITHYLRQHQDLLIKISRIPGFSWLPRFWSWLENVFQGWNQRVIESRKARRAKREQAKSKAASKDAVRFLSLRRLSPKQRIYFFFQAMVRRGGEKGVHKGISHTPYEYASNLQDGLPEVDEEISSMTDAFVSARYSLREVDSKEANIVKRYWDRVRTALRSKRYRNID